MNIDVLSDIKESIVDDLLEHFGITGNQSGGEQSLVEGVRRMLDDASNDDIEVWITKPNCEFRATLSLSITKHEKPCVKCKGWPTSTVCPRCKDSGFEPEAAE